MDISLVPDPTSHVPARPVSLPDPVREVTLRADAWFHPERGTLYFGKVARLTPAYASLRFYDGVPLKREGLLNLRVVGTTGQLTRLTMHATMGDYVLSSGGVWKCLAQLREVEVGDARRLQALIEERRKYTTRREIDPPLVLPVLAVEQDEPLLATGLALPVTTGPVDSAEA